MSIITRLFSNGTLCFCCPGVRPRSRQPVKRYKKLLADVFRHSQEEGPNDRKLRKLCEYASRNPLCMPKITESLEQRCYKELRNENLQHAKIVACMYRRLLVSCEELMMFLLMVSMIGLRETHKRHFSIIMPSWICINMTGRVWLRHDYTSCLHSIIHTLLDQSQQYEMQIIGCQTFFDFVNHQKDGTNMYNFEGFIPKLIQLAHVVGEDERAKSFRSTGLQALSAMVCFMGQHCYISAEFDNIVPVVVENYCCLKKASENPDCTKKRWVQEVLKNEGLGSASPDAFPRGPSWKKIVNDKGAFNVTL